MARIHLIENNKDIDLAKRFEQGLQRHHNVSWDINFLVPGQEWRRSLREAVLAADGLVALFAENSVREHSNVISSQWMAADIGAARALRKFVIPVIIGAEVQIPALVDDIFVARAASTNDAAIKEAISQVEDAILTACPGASSRWRMGASICCCSVFGPGTTTGRTIGRGGANLLASALALLGPQYRRPGLLSPR
jgi:hypothetical protein